MGNADNILILKSEGTPPERLRFKWKYNSKVNLKEAESDMGGLMCLRERILCRGLVDSVMNLRIT